MASLQQLQDALVAADQAGNTADARAIAQAIAAMRSTESVAPAPVMPQSAQMASRLPLPVDAAPTPGLAEKLADPGATKITGADFTPNIQPWIPPGDPNFKPPQVPIGNDPHYAPAGPMSLGTAAYGLNAPSGPAPMDPIAARTLGNLAASSAIQGGGAAMGQRLGAPGGMIGTMVGGAVGGAAGNALDQFRTMGPSDRFRVGPMLSNAAMGAIPGSSYAKMTGPKLAGDAVKQSVGNVAAKSIETAVDSGRAPTQEEIAAAAASGLVSTAVGKFLDSGNTSKAIEALKLSDTPRNRTLADGLKAGFVVAPSMVNTKNPSMIESVLESLGGKAATSQEASLRNQGVTDNLIRSQFGLPEGTPLVYSKPDGSKARVTDDIRASLGAPWKEAAAIATQAKTDLDALNKSLLTATNAHQAAILSSSPAFVKAKADAEIRLGADVEALNRARFDAKESWGRYLSGSGGPDALKEARSASALADKLDTSLEDAVTKAGRPDIADGMRKNRVLIAQTYAVEPAINVGDGHVDASVLGRAQDAGIHLTGNLSTVASFEQAFGRNMREQSKVQSPNIHQLMGVLGGGAGVGVGMRYGPVAGAATALAPFVIPKLSRDAVLGRMNPYLAQPKYATQIPDTGANAAKFTTEAMGRSNPFLDYLSREFPRTPSQPQQQQIPAN